MLELPIQFASALKLRRQHRTQIALTVILLLLTLSGKYLIKWPKLPPLYYQIMEICFWLLIIVDVAYTYATMKRFMAIRQIFNAQQQVDAYYEHLKKKNTILNITFTLNNILFLFITQRGFVWALIAQVLLLFISFPSGKILQRYFLRNDVVYT
jgi:hypothetical protein